MREVSDRFKASVLLNAIGRLIDGPYSPSRTIELGAKAYVKKFARHNANWRVIFPDKARKIVARYIIKRRNAFIRKVGPSTFSNPRPIVKQRYYKAAVKASMYLYKHFKTQGVPSWVWDKVPGKIRPIVKSILDYNDVRVRA